MRNLSRLRIDELILHEVPQSKRKEIDQHPLTLSDLPVNLDTDNRLYVMERLRKSLADARDVVEMEDTPSVLPSRVRAYLDGLETDFVELSKSLAELLRDSQSGINNAGLFMLATCTWERQPGLLIAKVELERGVRAQQTTVKGKATYDMTLIRDLVFGQTSRVFKVGVFINADLDEKRGLLGVAVDRQAGGPDIAGFFLNRYLGCEYVADARLLTKRFADTTEEFVNDHVDEAEKRARYTVALMAEMESQAATIRPEEFARRTFDDEDRAGFEGALAQAGLPRRFNKSTEFVALRHVRMVTEHDIAVIATADQIRERVVVPDADGVVVHDPVRRVEGLGRSRRRRREEIEPTDGDDRADEA